MKPKPVYKPYAKQRKFLLAKERESLIYGASGTGKTFILALKLFYRLCQPNAREAIVRKFGVDIHKSTLQTLRTMLADNGIKYKNNVRNQELTLPNGSVLLYGGIDEPERWGGIELTGCCVDEAAELDKRDWIKLTTIIRIPHKTLPNCIYAACNPGAPDHWLCEYFGIGEEYKGKKRPNRLHIGVAAWENTFMPPSVLDTLANISDPVERARLYEGKWVAAEGRCFHAWDRQRHMFKETEDFTAFYVGCDDGSKDAFSLVRFGQTKSGRLCVTRTLKRSRLLTQDKISLTKDFAQDAEAVVVDSAAATLILDMKAAGIPAIAIAKVKGSIHSGIARVNDRLGSDIEGKPSLSVDPNCVELIKEMEGYEWRKARGVHTGQQIPKHGDYHAVDALRYLIVWLDGLRKMEGASISLVTAHHAKPTKDETVKEYIQRKRKDPDWGWDTGNKGLRRSVYRLFR